MSKNQALATLNKTLRWLDKTEGRDKFCKAIQYACRFLKYRYSQQGNKEMEKKVDALFVAMRDARKLFRLFKTLKQYGKLLEVLAKRNEMQMQDFALNCAIRVFFGLYWIFDNLNILSKLGLLKVDAKEMGKKGSTCWFIALLANLVLIVQKIVSNVGKISAHHKSAINAGSEETKEKLSRVEALKKANSKQLLALVKVLGDLLPAGQGADIYQRVFGFTVNEGLCGIGGLVSAIITSYQLYQ